MNQSCRTRGFLRSPVTRHRGTAWPPSPPRGLFIAIGLLTFLACSPKSVTLPGGRTLKVSENQRFLVDRDGQPFFWLGDTAWELFHRLSREEADRYLEDRAQKGFTVVQAVALAELNGLRDPNPYGHTPLVNDDPTQPDIHDGPDNDYWDHVDYIVKKANSLGIVIGFLPSWGDKWNKKWGTGPEIFTPDNAEVYGQWLGTRYRDADVVWILGGDRPIENDTHREIIRRMALGLHKGDGGTHLHTFHPTGASGSAQYFHEAQWLDFNMRQNGHVPEFTGHYDQTRVDYDRAPRSLCSMASPSMRIIPSRSKPRNSATPSPPTCGGRCTGICLAAPVDTRTVITRSGRCGRPTGPRSTTRSCPGTKRSTNRAPVRCSMDAGSSSRGRF